MRVDHCPLPRPIAPNAVVSIDMSAFHAVGPHDVGVHGCQQSFHVTDIETVVEVLEEFWAARHRGLLLDLGGPTITAPSGLAQSGLGTEFQTERLPARASPGRCGHR